jgi:hypothetical protein
VLVGVPTHLRSPVPEVEELIDSFHLLHLDRSAGLPLPELLR